MSTDFILGQNITCLCVLTVLTVVIYVFGSGQRRPLLLLGGTLLALAAIGMRIMMIGQAVKVPSYRISAMGMVSVTLAVLSLAAVTGSFFIRRERLTLSVNWITLLVALSPVWLSGLLCVLIHDVSFLWSGLTVTVLTLWFVFNRDREKELQKNAQEIERQQAVLFQEQMQPHFLFNSMSVIHSLCDANPALAAEGIENLAGYLRNNLDALASDRLIPFQQEMAHIDQYVTLVKLNPTRSFEVVYDLAVIDFYLPALSIQPLVENAIRHGLRSVTEGGTVIVSTQRQGDAIRITVEDNGSGFVESMTDKQRERIGHGIANVRKRLESQCGGSLHINSDKGGTKMVVIIPKNGGESKKW